MIAVFPVTSIPSLIEYLLKMCDIFRKIEENEVENLRTAIGQFLVKYEHKWKAKSILKIFFRLFSIGCPFIVWIEFLHIAKEELSCCLKGLCSHTCHRKRFCVHIDLLNSLKKIGRIISEYDPKTIVSCGVNGKTEESWINFMRQRMRYEYSVLFPIVEIRHLLSMMNSAIERVLNL
jgi:hypothetical protein